MNSNDVNRIVMAIISLNFTMKEAHKSDQKSHENKQNTCESKLKILKELCDSNKTQAAEARKHEDAILNGIKQMGMNIAKAINSEITALSSCTNMLNEAALDTIMKQLHAMNHTKETPKSPDTNLLRSGYLLPPDRGPRCSESLCLQSLPEGHGLPFLHHAAGDTDACIHPHPPANYLSFH